MLNAFENGQSKLQFKTELKNKLKQNCENAVKSHFKDFFKNFIQFLKDQSRVKIVFLNAQRMSGTKNTGFLVKSIFADDTMFVQS